MTMTTPTPDVVDDMMSTMPPHCRPAVEDKTMTKMTPARHMDESGPGPRSSHSRSRSSSSEDPTKCRQSLQALPPDRPVARVLKL
jgi:hypothetical protein